LKKQISILFFLAINFIATFSYSQTDTIINGKKYKLAEETTSDAKNKKYHPPMDSMFVYNNKKLKFYNNWISAGGGIQQNLSYKKPVGFAGGVDLNFHVKHNYFQLGAILTGVRFGTYNNYQFHLGYGKRTENKDFHFAGFVGASYSTGYFSTRIDSITVYTRVFQKPGLYAQFEAVKKITYDVGIGVSVFGDFNQEQSIIGIRGILFFSGAYKGKKDESLR
jgi:hypothetical protein